MSISICDSQVRNGSIRLFRSITEHVYLKNRVKGVCARWYITPWHSDTLQVRKLLLPLNSSSEELASKGVIPSSFPFPQGLYDHLCSDRVGGKIAQRVILTHEHPVHIAKCWLGVCHRAMLVPQDIGRTMPMKPKCGLLWIGLIEGQPQLTTIGSGSARQMGHHSRHITGPLSYLKSSSRQQLPHFVNELLHSVLI